MSSSGGFVKCSLCPADSLRRYALGRKFSQHLCKEHPDTNHEAAVEVSKASLTPHCAPLVHELPSRVIGGNGDENKTNISLSLDDGLSLMDAGKGVTAGFVKCPLCTVKSMKRYAFGRGFAAHLNAIHPEAEHTKAVMEAKSSLSSPGLDRRGNKAVDYKDSLPQACQMAKAGDLPGLMSLNTRAVQLEGDKFGANALDWASGEGHLPCVKYLVPMFPLKDSPTACTIRRRDGKSCLHWCCRNGHIEVLDYLVSRLYQPEALHLLGTGDGTTPVHIACFGGHVHLLKHHFGRSDFHHTNNWGCLPEHFACMSARACPALFDFLLETVHGGDHSVTARYFFSYKNSEGMTPVHKWLLYMSKDGREVEESLQWLAALRLHLPADEPQVPAPGEVVSWIQERCGYLLGKLGPTSRLELSKLLVGEELTLS
eukprot:GSChrysophyteH1.ASY1.ANO1.2393.1 assembled CDS